MPSNIEVSKAPTTEWQEMREKAKVMLNSGFLPKSVSNIDKCLAIAITGKELGIPFMQALRGINVIDSIPVVKPELLLALCIQRIPGFKFWWGETTDTSATVFVNRPEMGEPFKSVFTIEEATKIGLTSKMNWKNYPSNMLRWRALANALHATCPEVLVGVYTPDEINAETDAEGEIIEVQHVEVANEPETVSEAAAIEVFICEGCGDEIAEHTLSNGKVMSVQELIKDTQKQFKKNYCYRCGKEQYNLKKNADKQDKAAEIL